ncbi:MAG: phosphatidate cytidylyltransferase [Deltaproteobacteria bacterium]|nr:phosphatidate cytidylyltransferase [Deltaproteobacteria bacterium]
MFRQRVATAIVLIAVIGATVFFARPVVFQGLVLLAVLFALAEYNRLALSHLRFYRLTALLSGMLVGTVQTWPVPWMPIDLLLILLTFLVAVLYLWRTTIMEGYVERLALAMFGSLYIALSLPYLGRMRLLPHGQAMIVMTLTMVALSDTAAYVVGKTLGRRKFASMASPNKTMEGFYASFVGSMIAVLLTRWFLWRDMPIWPALGLGVVIGMVGPFGDLIESAIKRGAHVKDSGSILPGHGGVLDRSDAYLFSAPVVYYAVQWFF